MPLSDLGSKSLLGVEYQPTYRIQNALSALAAPIPKPRPRPKYKALEQEPTTPPQPPAPPEAPQIEGDQGPGLTLDMLKQMMSMDAQAAERRAYETPADPQGDFPVPRTPVEGDNDAERAAMVEGVTEPAPQESKTYEIQSGDSLWKIAERLTGDGRNWKKLYEMNRDVLGDDPDRIRIGQVLRLA